MMSEIEARIVRHLSDDAIPFSNWGRAIADATGTHIGTVYVTLGRMLHKEYLAAKVAARQPSERGAPKRLYVATDLGRDILVLHDQREKLLKRTTENWKQAAMGEKETERAKPIGEIQVTSTSSGFIAREAHDDGQALAVLRAQSEIPDASLRRLVFQWLADNTDATTDDGRKVKATLTAIAASEIQALYTQALGDSDAPPTPTARWKFGAKG